MCGRFTLYTPRKLIARVFDYDGLFDLSPRYHIAPTPATLAPYPYRW
jgi:putative SOS response-associated peptidase YedK